MRFLAEDDLACEIAEKIKKDCDYHSRTGYMSFSYEFDMDNFIIVEGNLDYLVSYEEAVNYSYISFAIVEITSIKIFNSEGDEIDSKYNESAIEKYIKEYLTE
jgi:hypothetical protein